MLYLAEYKRRQSAPGRQSGTEEFRPRPALSHRQPLPRPRPAGAKAGRVDRAAEIHWDERTVRGVDAAPVGQGATRPAPLTLVAAQELPADEGNPNSLEAKPKLSQMRASSSKARKNSSEENPCFSFAELSLFNYLRRPPTAFFLFGANSGFRCRGEAGVFAQAVRRSFGLRFRFLQLFEQGMKGWRRFMIADARASFVRLVGRGADEREKGTPASTDHPGHVCPGTATSRKKTGRSIRRSARIRPLGKSPNRFRAQWTSGRAPALHASRVSHNPCLQDLSLPFRSCVAHVAALRRARDNAFHPATEHYIT